MKHTLTHWAVAASSLLAVGGASAGVVSTHATIDLSQAITGKEWTGFAHALDSVLRVNNGDTVKITIDFKGNQQLTWQGGFFQPWLMLKGFPDATDYNYGGSFTLTNLAVTLIGLTEGTQFSGSQLRDTNSSYIHLGPTDTLGGDEVKRTFSGASLSFDATWTEPQPYREYGTIGYDGNMLFNGTVSYTNAASNHVPEPSSMAAGLAALAALGLVSRRRRA